MQFKSEQHHVKSMIKNCLNKHWNVGQLDMCIQKFREGHMTFICEGNNAFEVPTEILLTSQTPLTLGESSATSCILTSDADTVPLPSHTWTKIPVSLLVFPWRPKQRVWDFSHADTQWEAYNLKLPAQDNDLCNYAPVIWRLWKQCGVNQASATAAVLQAARWETLQGQC